MCACEGSFICSRCKTDDDPDLRPDPRGDREAERYERDRRRPEDETDD